MCGTMNIQILSKVFLNIENKRRLRWWCQVNSSLYSFKPDFNNYDHDDYDGGDDDGGGDDGEGTLACEAG